MKNMMEYKGYHAKIEYSGTDKIFCGQIDGISDLVLFEGESVTELRDSFINAVDFYIEKCKETGKEPQKPYKGTFNIRISPDLHKRAVMLAASKNTTLNKFVQQAISEKIKHESEAQSKISEN